MWHQTCFTARGEPISAREAAEAPSDSL